MSPANALRFYPTHRHISENLIRRTFGEHTGVLQSMLVSPIEHPFGLNIRSVTGHMPNYHRVLIDPLLEIRFHLAGYGVHIEEALIRFVGEGIERYSSVGSATLFDGMVEYGCHKTVSGRRDVLPLRLLQIFSESDRVKLGAGKYGGLEAATSETRLAWLPCPSLQQPTKTILTPMQVLFMGHKVNRPNEARILPTFSTGTAAHTNFQSAFLNSLLEIVQIDALMFNWYTLGDIEEVILDDTIVSSLCASLGEFTLRVVRYPVTASPNVYVFGAILEQKNGKRPLLVFGSQADLDPVRGVYRAVMEACAITFLGFYGALFAPDEYFPNSRRERFVDLDSNVGWYANPYEADKKKAAIFSRIRRRVPLSSLKSHSTGTSNQDVRSIVENAGLAFRNAVFLDVTPPEVRQFGWYVVRIFAPELITMCLPSVPYSQHPKFLKAGGISNEFPHPLP